MNSDKAVTPVFVLGVQHSGTTILNKMLAMHPDLVWFSQFSQRDGTIPGRLRIPFHSHVNRFLRSCFVHDWQKRSGDTKEGRWKEYFVPAPRERSQIWDHILPSEDMVHSSEFVQRMYRLFEKECRDWGKRFLIVKFVALTPHIGILQDAYPNARFIHIVRDGRAVAMSIRTKIGTNDDPERIALEKAAEHWMEVLGIIQKQRENLRLFELRYEDFCRSPRRHISQVLDFIGLDGEGFPFERCPEALKVTNSKWFDLATGEELEMLNSRLEGWLSFYGYEGEGQNPSAFPAVEAPRA
jgi:hypothetical protein